MKLVEQLDHAVEPAFGSSSESREPAVTSMLPSRSNTRATAAARLLELIAALGARPDADQGHPARPIPPPLHPLRDRRTLEDVAAYLAEQRAAALLLMDGQTLEAQVARFDDGAVTFHAHAPAGLPAPADDGALTLARVEVHGVIFLIRGRPQPIENGYRFEAPVQIGTLQQRAIRRVSLREGQATLHWLPTDASLHQLRGAKVTDFAVDGACVAEDSAGELPPARNPFPALLELAGEQFPCLAEVCSDQPASSRGIRLHAPEGRALLAAAYLKQRFPQLISRREASSEAVTQLFERSGYLDLRSGTRPPDAWFTLPGTDDLSRDVCYRARDGQLLGHTSATRAYSRAWLGHQIATLRDHGETLACRHAIYLHIASFATLIDGEDTVMYGYFDRSKKWHQLFFHDFVRWVDNPRDAVIADLDRFERRDPTAPLPSPPDAPPEVEIGAPLAHELVVATALIRAQLPALVAETLDIHPERLVSRALHPRYATGPYTRARRVLVLRARGRLLGVALCELGSRELSLFNLFNMAFFFFAAGADAPSTAAQLALLAEVRALYARQHEHNPLIVAPPGVFDATAEEGTELVETMGLIAKSGRALRQYESFLDYHFGRHESTRQLTIRNARG